MTKNGDDAESMSKESIAFLEEVKKGKPRRFAMICKGTNILSLILFKKGSIESRKKEAKESGNGMFYHGVVDGKGQDIRFVLAKADGYDKEPVKATVLKAYLADAADTKCKPYFEVVDVAPQVADEDDAAQQVQSVGSQSAAPQSPSTQSPLTQSPSTQSPSTPPDEQASTNVEATQEALRKSLLELMPLVKQATLVNPNSKAELVAAVSNVNEAIKKGDFDNARSNLSTLRQQVELSLAAPPSAQASPAAVPPAAPASDEGAAIQARLKELLPDIKKALAGSDSERIKKLVDGFKDLVGRKDYAKASKVIDGIEKLLAMQPSGSTDGKQAVDDLYVASRTQWDSTRKSVQSSLERLESTIIDAFKGYGGTSNELLGQLEQATKRFYGVLESLDDRLIVKLNDALKTSDNEERKVLQQQAMGLIDEYRQFVNGNQLLSDIDTNPFISLNLRGDLLASLQGLSTNLK